MNDHPQRLIIRDFEKQVTRNNLRNICNYLAFVYKLSLKIFKRNNVWTLLLKLDNHTIVRIIWVFKNKLDENVIIICNKVRLVVKGYNQEESIDYDETYASVARLEAIRMLLLFACVRNFKLFQMDVKSAFLNGYIKNEVYVQ